MFYVYILYSEKHVKYYEGSSRNPWKRIERHNTAKFNTFTSKYRPWFLKAVFKAGTTRGEAEKVDKFINANSALFFKP